jgi:hypothetical protein
MGEKQNHSSRLAGYQDVNDGECACHRSNVPSIGSEMGTGGIVDFAPAPVLRADVAFAKPAIYEALKERGAKYAIRIAANDSMERGL